jgi:hypothetical protein
MEQRGEDPPTGIKLIIANKIGMVTFQRIENEGFIGFGNLQIGEPAAISQVKLGHNGLHTQTGQLGIHLDVNGFIGLDSNDELVTWDVFENA